MLGGTLHLIGLVLALASTPCPDVCAVLDMRYVRTEPAACVCFDPATKRLESFPRHD